MCVLGSVWSTWWHDPADVERVARAKAERLTAGDGKPAGPSSPSAQLRRGEACSQPANFSCSRVSPALNCPPARSLPACLTTPPASPARARREQQAPSPTPHPSSQPSRGLSRLRVLPLSSLMRGGNWQRRARLRLEGLDWRRAWEGQPRRARLGQPVKLCSLSRAHQGW